LLFPVATVAAVWAQQPADPAIAQAEAALRARVDQFYQLQVDKKFRQAESLVAEDSKDDYYNRPKQDIKAFSIQQVDLLDNNTRARVTIKGKVVMRAALIGAQEFDVALVTSWKVENGQWAWYIDPETKGMTPFGRMVLPKDKSTGATVAPTPAMIDPAKVADLVTLDNSSVTLNASSPAQTIMVTNNLPGPITLELSNPQPNSVSIEVEKSTLKAGEKSAITFRRMGETKSSGVVRLVASPVNKVFAIQVSSNQQ
jgi:hypothetical protein